MTKLTKEMKEAMYDPNIKEKAKEVLKYTIDKLLDPKITNRKVGNYTVVEDTVKIGKDIFQTEELMTDAEIAKLKLNSRKYDPKTDREERFKQADIQHERIDKLYKQYQNREISHEAFLSMAQQIPHPHFKREKGFITSERIKGYDPRKSAVSKPKLKDGIQHQGKKAQAMEFVKRTFAHGNEFKDHKALWEAKQKLTKSEYDQAINQGLDIRYPSTKAQKVIGERIIYYDPVKLVSGIPKSWFSAMVAGIKNKSDVRNPYAIVNNIWARLPAHTQADIRRRAAKGEAFRYDLPLPTDLATRGIGTLRIVKPFKLAEAQVNVTAAGMAAVKKSGIFRPMRRNDGSICQVARCKSNKGNVNIFADKV